MAEVIPQITVDSSKVKNTWVQNEVVTNEVYNAINKAVIDLKNNNNLLDTNSMLFREAYNSSSKNLNNAIHQGIYSFTNSAVNAPSGVNGGNLLVTNTSKTNQGTSIITQIAFCHNGAVYARTKNTSENFTVWNKLAYITDNVASATKATQDSSGQQINTTYIKGVTGSNATLTVTKGNGTTSTVTINNVSHATSADSSTNTGNFNQGFQTNDENFPTSTFRQTILGRADKGICARPFCGKLPNNTSASCSGMAFGGLDTHGFIQLECGTPNVYVGGGNANKINWYKKLAITDSPAFSGTPTAPTPSTSDNSTKIATTAFVNNYAPTKTGTGASGTWGINISGNAKVLSETHITGDTTGVNLPFGTTWSTVNNNNFPCTYGNCLSIRGSGATQIVIEWNGSDATAGRMFFRNARDASLSRWSPWREIAYTTGNIASATKATQDSSGQQINTTYIKGVTGSNATLTVTKGNGSTSTTTVNNVSRAEYSDRVGTNAGYTGSTTGSSLKGGLSQAAIYNNSFPFSYGNLISIKNAGANQIALEWSNTTGAVGRVAVRSARDASLETWSAWRYLAYTESPAFSGTPTAPTPSTSDNSTKIATTAFVKSLFTASKETNGWHKEASTGLIWQWGQEANYHDIMDNIYGSGGSLKFPISFPNKCLAVMPYLIGNKTFCSVSVSGFTNATITVHWDEWSHDVQSVKFGYIAVGY